MRTIKLFLFLVGFTGLFAQVDIDTLIDAQTGNSTLLTTDALGGERDLFATDVTPSVGSGVFSCTGSIAFRGCRIDLDGPDGDAGTFDTSGFAPVDLTEGGLRFSFTMQANVISGSVNAYAEFCDSNGCDWEASPILPSGTSIVEFEFANYPSIDFTDIVAVRIQTTSQNADPFNVEFSMPRSTTPVDLQSIFVE